MVAKLSSTSTMSAACFAASVTPSPVTGHNLSKRFVRFNSVIVEIREDADGEYHHLITLWKAIKEESVRILSGL